MSINHDVHTAALGNIAVNYAFSIAVGFLLCEKLGAMSLSVSVSASHSFHALERTEINSVQQYQDSKLSL